MRPRCTACVNERSGPLPGRVHRAALLVRECMFNISLVWRLLWGLWISSGQKVKGWKDGWLTQWIKLWPVHYLWLGAYGISPAALQGAEQVPSPGLAGPVRVCWSTEHTEQRHLNLQLGLKNWEANPGHRKQHSDCSSLCIWVCASPQMQENIIYIYFNLDRKIKKIYKKDLYINICI